MMRLSSIFSHAAQPAFWDECERASLLVSRVTDKSGGNPIARTMLRKADALIISRDKVFAAAICCYLYGAWAALSESVKKRTESGYEPDEHLIRALESANNHIFHRVMVFLSKSDGYLLSETFVSIYNNIAKAMRSEDLGDLDLEELIKSSFSGIVEV